MAKTTQGLEIDEDRPHQRREWRIQRMGWAVMALLVLACLAGLLGDGPIGRTTRGDAGLRVDYNRLQRAAAPTEYRFSVDPALARDGTIALRLEDTLLEEVHLRRIVPEPASTRTGPGYTEFDFEVAGGPGRPARIVFDIEPTTFGRVTGRAATAGAPPIVIDQFVFP